MASLFMNKVSIRVVIDEVENKVLFVQGGKDFVDMLLSFLMLPLGTIARLVSKESTNVKKVNVGSITTLYESVVNLEKDHFWSSEYKEMLVKPRNSMEEYCQNMKLKIDETGKSKYFICESSTCDEDDSMKCFIKFKNRTCTCGKLMNREISFKNNLFTNRGFVPDTATFMILDDLTVKPDNYGTTINKPKHLGYDALDSIKQLTMNVTKKEILELLKWSLVSSTPLTDVFLLKKQFHIENTQRISVFNFDTGGYQDDEETGEGNKRIKVKVMVRKSTNTILFAKGEEDFADFILCFLTFPMVGVEHMLKGNTKMGSIDNLYQSLLDLDPSRYLRFRELDDNLKSFRLAHEIFYVDHLIPLTSYYVKHITNPKTRTESGYLTCTKKYTLRSDEVRVPLTYLEPNVHRRVVGGGGFIKSPSLYMVTDDLVVTPGSSAATIAFITKLGIPTYDLEEREITIGEKEGLSLMKAFLTSSSALTNGLGPFLGIMNENNPKY